MINSLLISLIGANIIDTKHISFIELSEYATEASDALHRGTDPTTGRAHFFRERAAHPDENSQPGDTAS